MIRFQKIFNHLIFLFEKRIVDVDFAAKALEPRYFHGMKLLLQTYLDNKQWDISGFVDLILGQPMVGTVIKTVDDEDDGLYSFVTALNLRRYEASYSRFFINLSLRLFIHFS